MPAAVPIREGRYSCPMTTTTLDGAQAVTAIGTSSTSASKGEGAITSPSRKGTLSSVPAMTTRRLEKRSASWAPSTVPTGPAVSSTASASPPAAFDWCSTPIQ